MNIATETQRLVHSIEPLFFSCLKLSRHHNLDEIRISTGRAKEIYQDLTRLKLMLKELERPERSRDTHLDVIFNIN